jgi:hypothetical protein
MCARLHGVVAECRAVIGGCSKRVALACAVSAVAAGGPLAAGAHAGCGGVRHAAPRHIDYAHRPPLALGDSTMLLAVKPLARVGIEANARGCRQYPEALDLLRRLKRHRRLAKVVIIALGPNGPIRSKDLRSALSILGPKRILVLVPNREAGGGSGSDAALQRRFAKTHPKRVRSLDWVRASAGHGSYFSGDGLHLSFTGVDAFVGLLRRALKY